MRLKTLAVLVFSMSILGSKLWSQQKKDRPNIIFLLTDDQRWDAVGCMGNKEILTPNIDRIGNKGVVFKNFYNTTSICMASRAQMMTGMYEFKTGCNFNHGPLTKYRFQNSYPVLLRKSGYKVGFTGKFGFAVKESAEENSNYKTDKTMPIAEFDWWKGWPGQGYYQTEKNKVMQEYAAEYPHISQALGAASVDFIQAYANKEAPFCLSVSFKAPHKPVSPDKQYDAVYKGKTFTKPPNYGQEGAAHLPLQAKSGRQYKRLGERWNENDYDVEMAKYYQLIYGVDVAVGMILDELEKVGEADNTIIIYTTDNGYSTGAHGFGGKVLPYEEAAKGPLLIYVPGAKSEDKGWISNALVGNIDMAPTILAYAGVEIPANMDGKSLAPLLEKKNAKVKEHQAIVQAWGDSPTHSLSIVTEDYKYLYWFYGEGMEPQEELYRLDKDSYEMHNLAKDAAAAKQLKNMQKIYDQYVNFIKEEAVETNKYPEYKVLYDRNIPWSEKRGLIKLKGEATDKEKTPKDKSKKPKKAKKTKKETQEA